MRRSSSQVTLLSSNLRTARKQRRSAFGKLEYIQRRISDGESALWVDHNLFGAPGSWSVLGLFFTSCGCSFVWPLPVYAFQNEYSLTNRVLTSATFAGLGLSESSSISFRAQTKVAAKRIAYFLSSIQSCKSHCLFSAPVPAAKTHPVPRLTTKPSPTVTRIAPFRTFCTNGADCPW